MRQRRCHRLQHLPSADPGVEPFWRPQPLRIRKRPPRSGLARAPDSGWPKRSAGRRTRPWPAPHGLRRFDRTGSVSGSSGKSGCSQGLITGFAAQPDAAATAVAGAADWLLVPQPIEPEQGDHSPVSGNDRGSRGLEQGRQFSRGQGKFRQPGGPSAAMVAQPGMEGQAAMALPMVAESCVAARGHIPSCCSKRHCAFSQCGPKGRPSHGTVPRAQHPRGPAGATTGSDPALPGSPGGSRPRPLLLRRRPEPENAAARLQPSGPSLSAGWLRPDSLHVVNQRGHASA